MNVLLIDADSKIPNLALMKLSTYYKGIGANISLVRLNLSYYPTRKRAYYVVPPGYDKIFCSVIFLESYNYILHDNNVEFGGTGYSLSKELPNEIELLEPDYSLYGDNDVSYGFISRGCIRNCSFCFVPRKEGTIHQVNSINNIVRHNKTMFMDNNFLALPNHKELLQELVDKKIKCQFNQGFDIRLIDNENSLLLSKLKYLGNYIFAFDSWSYISLVDKKLELLDWRKPWQLKFFVYCNPEMTISETINRLNYLRDNCCLPYLMRDISCWESDKKHFYTDLAAWCNQPNLFKKMLFRDFLYKRHPKNKERQQSSYKIYLSK